MGGEGEDSGIKPAFIRSLDEETQDLLMSEVKAVEVPYGHCRRARKRRQMVEAFEDLHGFSD